MSVCDGVLVPGFIYVLYIYICNIYLAQGKPDFKACTKEVDIYCFISVCHFDVFR